MATLTMLALLAGCSSKPERPTLPPTERQSLDRSARLAFDQERYAQAVTLYGAVLQASLAEDDPAAIVDARFNIALSQTYLGNYTEAMAEARRADLERRRRGLPIEPDLELLIGTIHYRADEPEQAHRVLSRLLDGGAGPTTTARAHFVLGLISADASDKAGLHRHVQALGSEETAMSPADYLELSGRLAALEGRADEALAYLDRAAAQRAGEADYRGMARTLAAAGGLVASTGPAVAAAYYFRAGRSAAQRGEPEALGWLEQSRSLAQSAGDPVLAREAAALMEAVQAGELR